MATGAEQRERGPSKKSLERRAEILQAATELFAVKGYHGTGVAELSAVVGLGAGALYHHIGSKEELLFNICRPHVEEVKALGERLAEQDMPALEKLYVLARKHMSNVATRPLELQVTLREIDSLTGPRKVDMHDLRDGAERVWDRIVAQGVARGEFVDLDPLFVKLILGALNYAVVWFQPGGPASADEVAVRTVDLLLGSSMRQSSAPTS